MKVEWPVDPAEFSLVASAADPERLEAVIDAVEALPEHCRVIVNMLFWEGLSAPAAIRELGISPATFYRHWKEARERLAAVLGGDAVGPVPAGE